VDLDSLRSQPNDDGGGTDAAPDVASSKRFCETVDADYCEDMDNDAALAKWYTPDAGAMIESTTASSAPSALHMFVQSQASCVDQVESLPILPNAIDHATFDADVFMDPPSSNFAYDITLRFGMPNDVQIGCFVMIGSSPTSDQIYVQAYNHNAFSDVAVSAATLLPPTPVGRWRHVSVQVDFAKDFLSWNVDGSNDTHFGPVQLASSVCKGMGLTEVALGAHCVSQPSFSYRYDNVVIQHH
jgi:hypothetical protein